MSTLILMDDDPIDQHPKGLTIDDHIIFMLDPNHKHFKKNIIRAISHGFRYPLLSTKLLDTPLRNDRNDRNDKGKDKDKKEEELHLFLYHKYNDEYGKEIDDEKSKKIKKQVDFCLDTYQKNKEDVCSIHIKLSEEAINYLHDYSKTYRFHIGNGKHEQREISGRFMLYETSPNTFLVTVDKETSNRGEKEETSSINTLASFHTHPLEAYHKYKVCMAWPSVDDYCVFLGIYANGYGMFHILGTVEGIYVITISKRLAKEGREKIKNNMEYYEKQIREYYHINYPTCSIQEDDDDNHALWLKKIEKYLKTMNAKKYFNIQFILWKDADQLIPIHYQSIDRNCMISDEQIKFNNFLSQPITLANSK